MLSIPSLQERPRSYIPYSQLPSLFMFAYLDCDSQELPSPKICRGSFSVDSDHSPGVINLPGIRLLESRTVLHLDPMIHAILLRRVRAVRSSSGGKVGVVCRRSAAAPWWYCCRRIQRKP